jgi:hypothetical protein
VDNTNTWSPAYEYIVRKLDEYLEQEGKVKRSKIVDNRVDALCYFISPNSNGLRPLDVTGYSRIIPFHVRASFISLSYFIISNAWLSNYYYFIIYYYYFLGVTQFLYDILFIIVIILCNFKY